MVYLFDDSELYNQSSRCNIKPLFPVQNDGRTFHNSGYCVDSVSTSRCRSFQMVPSDKNSMSLGRLSPAPWVIQTRHSSAMARYLDSHFNIHSVYCGPPPGFENVNIAGNTYQDLWMHHRSYDIEPLGHVSERDAMLQSTPIRISNPDPSWTPQKMRTAQINSRGLKIVMMGPANAVARYAHELQSFYGARHLNIENIMVQDGTRRTMFTGMCRRGLPAGLYGTELAIAQLEEQYVRENGYVLTDFPRTLEHAKMLEFSTSKTHMEPDILILFKSTNADRQYFREYKLFDQDPNALIFDIDHAILPPRVEISPLLEYYTTTQNKSMILVDMANSFEESMRILHTQLGYYYKKRMDTGYPPGFAPSLNRVNSYTPAPFLNGFY